MRKIKNRFTALLMVFTSIISFLPVGFSGQAASAAASLTQVSVYTTDNKVKLVAKTDDVIKQDVYSVTGLEPTFDITVEDSRVDTTEALSEKKLVDTVNTTGQSATGVVFQDIQIISINGISWQDSAGKTILTDEIGVNVIPSQNPDDTSAKRLGQRITGLPLGVNKITYQITTKTQTIDYVPAVKDASGNITTPATYHRNDPTVKQYAEQTLKIEHGTQYAIEKISPMMLNAYIGSRDKLDDASYIKNNKVPFKYSTEAKADSNMPLRYTFDVPDSIEVLEYNMTFASTLGLDTKIYRNGVEAKYDLTTDADGKSTLTGYLATLGQSDIILLKLAPANGVKKSYAIELKYNKLDFKDDYSLQDAGITKHDFANDPTVEAYIGKRFTVDTDSGFKTYKGTIHVDSKAGMISIDPKLVKPKSTVAYVVTNKYYYNGQWIYKKSELDGKQFIDFMASPTGSNIIQIDVYDGVNGNKTGASILARYELTVEIGMADTFSLGIAFDDSINANTYLTQTGVKTNKIDFSKSRLTYDLYYTKGQSSIKVSSTGTRSSKNEYLRVWLGTNANSNSLIEAVESSLNPFISGDPKNGRKDYLDIAQNLNKTEKMVVQAYYDQFEYDDTDPTKIKTNTDGTPIYKSYPIGDKYTFYIPNNYSSSTIPATGETSNNATLNFLKISGYTLKDSNGKAGFSIDESDYTTTVTRGDTTVKLTPVAQDANVKSITATINGGTDSYDLFSNETTELPLSTSGKTTIRIVVTAQDGVTKNTYTVLVQNNTKSSSAKLKNVILNVGDYTFDPNNGTTKVRVDQNITSIKVTPQPEDANSKITVSGQTFLQTPITIGLKGAQKTEINIVVLSEDGTMSKTYTLEVYRVSASDWQDTSPTDDPNEDDQFYDEYNGVWVDLTKYDQWGSVNGKPAYFDKKSRQVKEAWITTGGKMYYLNNLGYRASGWKIDDADGKTYYLDPVTGELKKQWMNLDGKWYYFGLNGVMKKGWLNLNNKWYYFTPNGQMVVSQTIYIDDEVCRFGQDGVRY